MQYFVTTNTASSEQTDCVVVAVFNQGQLSASANELNDSSNGQIQHYIDRGDITGKVGQTLLLQDLSGINSPRVLVIGAGDQAGIKENDFNTIISTITKTLDSSAASKAALYITEIKPMTAQHQHSLPKLLPLQKRLYTNTLRQRANQNQRTTR